MRTGPATSKASVELVRRFLDYLANGGVKSIEAHLESFCRPDVEWVPAMLTYGKERYVGKDEYRKYLQEAWRSDGGEISVQEVRAVRPDLVLALSWIRYTGDGQDIFSEYALLIGLQEGRFASIRSFMSHAAAERALKESDASEAGADA